MEGFSKAIQQPEYVHVLLNHLPLTGLLIAVVFLLIAWVINHRTSLLIALALVGLLSLSVWPVAEFGEEAYDRVLSMADDAGGQYLKYHAQLADHWLFLYYITAAAAAAAWIVGWKKTKMLRWAGGMVAVLAVASLAAGAMIAEAGGKIRHREFRYGPPPPRLENSEEVSSEEVSGLYQPEMLCSTQG